MAKKTETKTPAATYEIGQDVVITCSPRSIHYRREYNDCIATIVNNETVMRLGVIALRLYNLRYKSGSLPENGADMLEKNGLGRGTSDMQTSTFRIRIAGVSAFLGVSQNIN